MEKVCEDFEILVRIQIGIYCSGELFMNEFCPTGYLCETPMSKEKCPSGYICQVMSVEPLSMKVF